MTEVFIRIIRFIERKFSPKTMFSENTTFIFCLEEQNEKLPCQTLSFTD